MKRRDFYKGTIKIIKECCEMLQRYDNEIAGLKDKIKSGRYSQNAISEFTENINAIHRQTDTTISESLTALKDHIKAMRVSLDEEMSLRGSDITPDADLLKYNLSAKEMVAIMNRHENNPTMVQLILKNAEERGIDLGVQFVGNDREMGILNGIEYAAKVVFNNRYQSDIFDTLFGEGTDVESMFNVADPPPAVTLAYSDERIANAVKLLSDNRCLNPDIQKDIISEFENRPAVLSILRNAAVRGHNFDAVHLIDDAIKSENNKTEE